MYSEPTTPVIIISMAYKYMNAGIKPFLSHYARGPDRLVTVQIDAGYGFTVRKQVERNKPEHLSA
mgnify:CR=1 FL=1